MKFTELLKLDNMRNSNASIEIPPKVVASKSSPISTFSERDVLVDFEDVAKEFSENAGSEKLKKNQRSKKSCKKEPKHDIFTMKMYGDEKPRLEALSKAANTDMSSFARKRIFSDEGIIILDNAHYISRSLIEISDTLRTSKIEDPVSKEMLKKIFEKLCDIANVHIAICKELTIFKSATEEEEE